MLTAHTLRKSNSHVYCATQYDNHLSVVSVPINFSKNLIINILDQHQVCTYKNLCIMTYLSEPPHLKTVRPETLVLKGIQSRELAKLTLKTVARGKF